MIVKVLQIAVPFIWFGLIAGISFIETPLKFKAPNMSLPLGLGIGRLVFSAMNKVEIVLAILLLISFLLVKPANKFVFLLFGAVSLLLILQTIWLLPVLDARAAAVISGNAAPASSPHIFYVVFEVLKFVLLFSLGISLVKSYLKFE